VRFIPNILLVIFVLLLATPAVVTTIDKNIDITCFLNIGEEECQDYIHEIKSIPTIYTNLLTTDFEGIQKVRYETLNEQKVDSFKPSTLLQPPELV
jgi:PhoPQ-activated pathogenicity-related protein